MQGTIWGALVSYRVHSKSQRKQRLHYIQHWIKDWSLRDHIWRLAILARNFKTSGQFRNIFNYMESRIKCGSEGKVIEFSVTNRILINFINFNTCKWNIKASKDDFECPYLQWHAFITYRAIYHFFSPSTQISVYQRFFPAHLFLKDRGSPPPPTPLYRHDLKFFLEKVYIKWKERRMILASLYLTVSFGIGSMQNMSQYICMLYIYIYIVDNIYAFMSGLKLE